MSVWRRNLSPYVWPWLEPIVGALFLFTGIKAIVTGEFHARRLVFHGVTCYTGGVMMIIASYLMFRGRLWTGRVWTSSDRIVGVFAGVGLVWFSRIVARRFTMSIADL